MKALITGATSGIGKAIAQEMSRRGISLILTGRNEEALLLHAGNPAGAHRDHCTGSCGKSGTLYTV